VRLILAIAPFICAARYGDGFEAEIAGILDGQVPQAANAVNGNHVAAAGAARLESAKYGASGAKQGRALDSIKLVGNRHDSLAASHHILGVSAIDGDAGYQVPGAG